MRDHGAKACNPGKGKPRQAPQRKGRTVNFSKIIFEPPGEFVATQRGREEGIRIVKAPRGQEGHAFQFQFLIGNRAGEIGFYHRIEVGIVIRILFEDVHEFVIFVMTLRSLGQHVRQKGGISSDGGHSNGIYWMEDC